MNFLDEFLSTHGVGFAHHRRTGTLARPERRWRVESE